MNKIVLFKEFGRYCITNENNYYATIRDANAISKFPVDCPKDEVIKSLLRWGIVNEEDLIDETGE